MLWIIIIINVVVVVVAVAIVVTITTTTTTTTIIIIIIIYIIISQNIRYLLWNRGAWRLLKNTYTLFLTPCIRCTNH